MLQFYTTFGKSMDCRSILAGNLEKLTLENIYFRRVISTSSTMQVVLMALPPQTSIGMEKHPGITQFFRVEQGEGIAQIGDEKVRLADGSFVFIHPDTYHNITNTSTSKWLKMYTIYSPPNHPCNRVDVTNPEH